MLVQILEKSCSTAQRHQLINRISRSLIIVPSKSWILGEIRVDSLKQESRAWMQIILTSAISILFSRYFLKNCFTLT